MLALVLSLLPVAAFAQTTVNSSGFSVQNVGSGPATVTVTYYRADGNVAATQTETIAQGGTFNFFGATMKVEAGFKGSVAISSDQPIVAITNLLGPSLSDAYGGFSAGATTVNVPLIMRDNFGLDTWVSIQNTGPTPATVTVTYSPGEAGSTGQTDAVTIAPNAAQTLYQREKAGLGTRFVGSAKIVSNQPVVAVVNQEYRNGTSLFTYGGFTTAGSTTAVTPLITANNFGQYTGITIQNTGTTASDVTVTFTPNTVTDFAGSGATSVCATPPVTTITGLAGGASKNVITSGGDASFGFVPFFATCRYVGSATITSTGSPIAVTVNQAFASPSTLGSAYVGVDPTTTVEAINAPILQANNFGTYSGIQLVNTGAAATNVTVTYGPNISAADGLTPASQTNCATPPAKTVSLPVKGSSTIIQSGNGSVANGFDPFFASCRYIGSAKITAASGGKITAVVNQVISTYTGDGLLTYSAFGQ